MGPASPGAAGAGRTADDALEALEAVIRQRLARYTREPSVNDDVAAILAAAGAYRHAAAPYIPANLHLAGIAGAATACRYRWQQPERLHVTGNTKLVSCRRCLRSRQYRDMTGRASRAA